VCGAASAVAVSTVTFDYAEFSGGTVTSIAPGTANITAL
jgi:hypothetical protein